MTSYHVISYHVILSYHVVSYLRRKRQPAAPQAYGLWSIIPFSTKHFLFLPKIETLSTIIEHITQIAPKGSEKGANIETKGSQNG